MDANQISNEPYGRVPAEMQGILSSGNVFIDAHCHVFNYRDVPDKFIGIRVPQNQRLLSYLEKWLHRIKSSTDRDKYSNLAYFIHFLRSRTTSDIAGKLFEYYPGRDLIICPLMMDMAQGIGGAIEDDFLIQIEKMKELRDAYPSKILPFIALDPNNPLMKENFLKVFSSDREYRFFGVKIYPSLGYLPSNPGLMEIFEICEEKKIPVTAHCSGASVHTDRKSIPDIRGTFKDTYGNWEKGPVSRTFKRKSDYAEFFNHPGNWIPVLEAFPKLKLNLAHFGGDDQWKDLISGKKNTWVHQITELMRKYENLYSDFSYTFYNNEYTRALISLMESDPLIYSRVLYGSDYYMVVTEGHFMYLWSRFAGELGPERIKKIAQENPMRFLFG
jgi:uncharacterized protein